MILLSWGCGPDPAPGWYGSDRDDHGQEHVGDIRDGLPFDSGLVDVVVANHSLSMVPYADLRPVLAELTRVLRPGGVLRIVERDAVGIVDRWAVGDTDFPIVAESLPAGRLCAFLTWYSQNPTCFTPAWLGQLLDEAGLDPAVVAHGLTILGPPRTVELDSRPAESIYVEGRKR